MSLKVMPPVLSVISNVIVIKVVISNIIIRKVVISIIIISIVVVSLSCPVKTT
jgi:hypothetical protein